MCEKADGVVGQQSLYCAGEEEVWVRHEINYNFPKSENAKQLKCPKDKEDAIVDALKHFKMI